MTTQPLGPRIARGLYALAGGRAVVMALQLSTMALLASYLGPAGLGVYTFGVATAALFKMLPNFGTVQLVTRDIAQAPERERELMPNLVYLRVVLGVATYGLLAASVVLLGFDDAEQRAALIAGLVVLIAADAFRSTLEVRLRLAWVSIADAVEAAATVAAVLLLMQADAGVESFLWVYAGLKLVNALIVTGAALRLGTFSWRVRTELWWPLLRAAVPLGLAGVLMALYFRLDVIILAGFKSAADVGQYGAAYRFLEAFLVVPTIAMSVLAPVMARSAVDDAETFQRRYGQAVHLIAVIAVGVGVVGAMTAWRVLPVIPGFDAFEGGGVALSILAPAAGLIFLGTVVQGVLISGHRQDVILRIAAVGLAVNVALNLALIPPFSYVGAAVATTATEVVLLVASIAAVRRRLELRWPVARLARLAAAALAAAAVLAAGLMLDPLLQLGLGAAAYAVALAAFGALRGEDVRPFLRGSRA